jgi:hypothetical protein
MGLRGLLQGEPMTKFIRLAAGVCCLGVLALGAVALAPVCPLTFSPHGDSAKRPSLAEAIGRNEQLDQRKEAMRQRREAKEQVAAEVIARRRSLAEAIEQFRALDRQWPDCRPTPQPPEELGMSEDEWDGRNVLDYVRLVLADRPGEAAAVAAQLEKELQQLLAERKKRAPTPTEGSC